MADLRGYNVAVAIVALYYQLPQAACGGTFNSNLGDTVVAELTKEMRWRQPSSHKLRFRCKSWNAPPSPRFSTVYRVYKFKEREGDAEDGYYETTRWLDADFPWGLIKHAHLACTAANIAAWPKPVGWNSVITDEECKKYVLKVLSSSCSTMAYALIDDMKPVRALFDSTAVIKKADLEAVKLEG